MSDGSQKQLQNYLDEVKAKTSKTVDDFRQMAAEKGLNKANPFVAWLKTEYGLGYHHAGAVWYMISHADDLEASQDEKIAAHFTGKKAKWREPFDKLVQEIIQFGPNIEVSPNMTYINLLRDGKKFAILQTSANHLHIGLKLKGVAPAGRLESAGSWNVMLTHRVRINEPSEMDMDVLAWLKQAYNVE